MKKNTYKSIIGCIIAILVFVYSGVFGADGNSVSIAVSIDANAPAGNSLSEICNLMLKGEFEQAKTQINTIKDSNSPQANHLKEIIAEYEQIEKRRQEFRKETLKEVQEEFAKLKTNADANGLDDINDITSVLADAIKLKEYSDESDKDKIMSDALVKQAIEKSLLKAQEYEDKGEWIDSLVRCYSFLTALDKDNKQWKEYQENLTDKAIIKASITDNPCETAAERFKGIKKEMFLRAVMVLDYNYVTTINYTDLAIAGLKRCILLCDVLEKMEPSEAIKFSKDGAEVANWKAEIQKLLNNTKSELMGVNRDKFLDIFQEVLVLNSKTLSLNEEVMIAQFAEASLAELDPHTNLVWPWYIEDFQKNMKSEFSGVGIEISKEDGPLKISSLLAGTPAYNSGLDAGEIIEAVDGESTADMTIECAVRKITGPEGTPVTLTVRGSKDDKSRDVTIIRAKIKVPAVKSWLRNDDGEWDNLVDKENKIGYIKITTFTSEQTSSELEKQIDELENKGMKGLIIDLRFNSGGYLNQAVEIVDKFIPEGKLIVSTRPRLGSFPTWEISTKQEHKGFPLVILINGQSASASEIVAGALQDPALNRAILVGSRSYGKGSVQTIVGYPGDGAQLKYTMAYYYLPSGQRVKNRYEREKLDKEDWGVAPDIDVELKVNEIRRLYDIQRDNSVLVSKNHNGDEEIKRHNLKECIEADPQLAIGILAIRTKIIEKELK